MLDRDCVKIYYEARGEGPTILPSHGFSATSAMWANQVEFARRFRLITWDMRGHGRSDYSEDTAAYSEATTVGDMAAILDAAGARSAIIGGLSLGGYMSLAFHLTHPERTRALLIIDTGPGYRNPTAATAGMPTRCAGRRARDPRPAHRGRRRGAPGKPPRRLRPRASGMLTQRDSRVIDSLPQIQVPTIVIVGADDTPFLAATDYMASRLPGARKVVISHAGHAVNIDQPEACNEALLDFLEENELADSPSGTKRR